LRDEQNKKIKSKKVKKFIEKDVLKCIEKRNRRKKEKKNFLIQENEKNNWKKGQSISLGEIKLL
jgi:hypothetical protein